MENGCKNHKETLYSPRGKIEYVVGNPWNIYRLQGNPIVIIGFSLHSVNVTGFPHNMAFPVVEFSREGYKIRQVFG